MKSYFAYIRVSTVKQGEHGSSLQEQKSAIEAYAARHDLTISQWFEETETAAKQGRREFAKLTGLLRNGKSSGVIIHKIDRSARNLKDWAGLGELIDAGVEVLFAHEGLDMQTRGGRLAADIQAVVAADFIRNLRDEVRKGFYGRLKQGFYPLPAPRGYVDCGKAKVKEIHPVEGPLVRLAFDLYATANYSLEQLRHELARRGLRSSNGRPLGYGSLANLLHNPFYVGLIRIYKTGEIFEGKHEPLISRRTFDRVQAILAGRLYPRVEKHEFLFRRLIRCQACSRSLTGERQKGIVYYRCHDRACKGVSVTESGTDEFTASELFYLSLDEKDEVDFRDLLQEQIAVEASRRYDRSAHVERDLALVQQRIDRVTDAFLDGSIDKSTFEDRKSDLFARKTALRDALENDEDSTFWQNVSQKFEQGLTAYTGYLRGLDAEKRDVVKLVSSNLVVHGKEPVFPMVFPFEEIRNWSKSTYGAPYQGAVRTLTAKQVSRRRRSRANVAELFQLIAAHEHSVTRPQSP